MNSRKEVNTLVFNLEREAWVPAPVTQDDIKVNSIDFTSFLTYNVWHKKENFEERSIELLKIIQESNADFVCLQEVTKDFFYKLLDAKWVQEEYYIPEISSETDTTLILSRMPCKFYMKQFATRMNRFLLYTEVEINNVKTAIGTVHLESLNNSQYRKMQLDSTFEELATYPKAILLGDFNFDWVTENKYILPHYVDTWPLLNPGSQGYTMPKTHDFIAWRPDKVLIKKNKKYRPLRIGRVGMEPLPKYQYYDDMDIIGPIEEPDDHAVRTPSDHFGLKFELEMLDDTKEEWSLGDQGKRRKGSRVYHAKKKGNYVWIDGTRRSEEHKYCVEELEKMVSFKKGGLKAFEKVSEAMEDILFKLDECDDLSIIVSLHALHELIHNWKKETKVIQDKQLHEKHFRFRVVVYTLDNKCKDAESLCRNAGFEKYFVCSKFLDVVDSLFSEPMAP